MGKKRPTQELLQKGTWQYIPTKAPTKKGKKDIHLAAKAAVRQWPRLKQGQEIEEK